MKVLTKSIPGVGYISAFLDAAPTAFDEYEKIDDAERAVWVRARKIARTKGTHKALLHLFRHGTITRNQMLLAGAVRTSKAAVSGVVDGVGALGKAIGNSDYATVRNELRRLMLRRGQVAWDASITEFNTKFDGFVTEALRDAGQGPDEASRYRVALRLFERAQGYAAPNGRFVGCCKQCAGVYADHHAMKWGQSLELCADPKCWAAMLAEAKRSTPAKIRAKKFRPHDGEDFALRNGAPVPGIVLVFPENRRTVFPAQICSVGPHRPQAGGARMRQAPERRIDYALALTQAQEVASRRADVLSVLVQRPDGTAWSLSLEGLRRFGRGRGHTIAPVARAAPLRAARASRKNWG